MPTDKRHNKVPQDKMLYHTQGEYKKKPFFSKMILGVLHDHTPAESILNKISICFFLLT